MCTVRLLGVICFTFINIVLCFAQHTGSLQADVIKHCENSTNSTTCSYNYEQLYNNLTKFENSFNISHALYPGRGKPSFLVKVNVFGHNKTNSSTPATFSWSIRCLYAAVPGRLLEVLSLWSITVTPRTQELNMHIPPFCCNVSDDEKKREEIIQRFLTRAITELQDMAVSPGIRDPSLNAAECSTQGHQPTFEATGRLPDMRALLWFSLLFAVCSGPLLANFSAGLKHIYQVSGIRKRNTAKALHFSLYIVLVGGLLELTAAFVFSCYYWHIKQATFDITVIIVVIYVCSIIESICVLWLYDDLQLIYNRCRKRRVWMKSFLQRYLRICGANAISYLFCWQIIGMRMNPTRGLTIALSLMCVYASLTYAIYLYFEVERNIDSDDKEEVSTWTDTTCNVKVNSRRRAHFYRIQIVALCASGCLAVLFLFVIVVLAGSSYIGDQTADDEALKTTSLYFLSAFISWVAWKKHVSDQQSGKSIAQNSDPTVHSISFLCKYTEHKILIDDSEPKVVVKKD